MWLWEILLYFPKALCLVSVSGIPAALQNKMQPSTAFWRVGFISYPVILYSLKIHTACAAPSPSLGFCAGWCLKLKELLCLRHPISAIGVSAEIAEKSEELLLSVHRKQFWALYCVSSLIGRAVLFSLLCLCSAPEQMRAAPTGALWLQKTLSQQQLLQLKWIQTAEGREKVCDCGSPFLLVEVLKIAISALVLIDGFWVITHL